MGPGEGAPELLVEHESSSGSRVIQVRGSLMVSSLQTLRELGHFERYLSHLPPEHRDSVLFALASSWLPVELAMVHYEACDTMELSTSELETIGQHVSTRIMGTFLGTLMRSSRQIGASTSPFVPLRQRQKGDEALFIDASWV